jgi:hypothetical protein
MSDMPAVTGSMPEGPDKARAISADAEMVSWSTLGGSLVLHVDSKPAPNFWLELNLAAGFLRARLAEIEGPEWR